MTMHLVHPSLSLVGKKKGKIKFRNADEARKSRELDQSWKELLKRQGVDAEEKKRSRAMKAEPLSYSLSPPPGRLSTQHIPSLGTTTGVASLPAPKVYTGTEMIGVGQLHKSNAIPIFRKEDAEDLAKMRR